MYSALETSRKSKCLIFLLIPFKNSKTDLSLQNINFQHLIEPLQFVYIKPLFSLKL